MKKLLPLLLPLVLFLGYGGKKELATKNAEPVTETNPTKEILKFDVGGKGFKWAAYTSLFLSGILIIFGIYFLSNLINEF